MAQKAKITETNAAALTKGELFDTQVDGFYVRAGKRANSFVFVVQVDGKNVRRTIGKVGIDKVADVRAFAAEEIAKLRRGTSELLEVNRGWTVGDAWAAYIEKRVKGGDWSKGMRDHRSRYDRFLVQFAERDLKTITTSEMQKLHNEMSKSATPRQADSALDLMSTLFNIGRDEGRNLNNPASSKQVERNGVKRCTRHFDVDDVRRILNAAEYLATRSSKSKPKFAQANLIVFLAATGARYSEAATATWDQFDLVNGIWNKVLLKTHKKEPVIHRVKLNPLAVEVVRRMNTATVYVFENEQTGLPFTHVRKTWAHTLELAEVEYAKLHVLRHSFVTNLLNVTGDVTIAQEAVGHRSIATTMLYVQRSAEDTADATNALSDMYTKSDAPVIEAA